MGTCRIGAKATNPLHWRVSCIKLDPADKQDNRQLSLLERRRFQGFPDGYKLKGPLEAREQMVGNAMHVGLVAAIARQIKMDAFADFVAE